MSRLREHVRLEDGLKLELSKLVRDRIAKSGAFRSSTNRMTIEGSRPRSRKGLVAKRSAQRLQPDIAVTAIWRAPVIAR
jgi:hypothetical protein